MYTLVNLQYRGPKPKRDIPTTLGLRTLYRSFTLEKGKLRLYIEGLKKDNHHILCRSARNYGWSKETILEKYKNVEKGYHSAEEILQRTLYEIINDDAEFLELHLMYYDSFVSFSRDLGYATGFNTLSEVDRRTHAKEVYLMEAYFPFHSQNEFNFAGKNLEFEVAFFYEAIPQRIRIYKIKFPLDFDRLVEHLSGNFISFYPLSLVKDCHLVYSWG